MSHRRGRDLSESEAEHALRDPFIEDWVEQTGHFKIHNMNEIQITAGVTLGSLGVVMLDERLFEIASADAEHPLTELKAKGVAEALRARTCLTKSRSNRATKRNKSLELELGATSVEKINEDFVGNCHDLAYHLHGSIRPLQFSR